MIVLIIIICNYNFINLLLADIFERVILAALLFCGSTIAFHNGQSSDVLSDAEEVKPTIFVR